MSARLRRGEVLLTTLTDWQLHQRSKVFVEIRLVVMYRDLAARNEMLKLESAHPG